MDSARPITIEASEVRADGRWALKPINCPDRRSACVAGEANLPVPRLLWVSESGDKVWTDDPRTLDHVCPHLKGRLEEDGTVVNECFFPEVP